MKPLSTSGLRLIGYWHSESTPDWPDPAWFVDTNWDRAERKRVVEFLRAGEVWVVSAGPSFCRFWCAGGMCGSTEQSDGWFTWPEGLAHYVEDHGVRLPAELVEHALASPPAPDAFKTRSWSRSGGAPSIDTAWWKAQKGHGRGASFRSPEEAKRWTLVAIVRSGQPTPRQAFLIRRCSDGIDLSVAETLERLRQGAAVPLFARPTASLSCETNAELEAAGVSVERVPSGA